MIVKRVVIAGVVLAGIVLGRNLWMAGWEEDRRIDAVYRKGITEIPYASTRGQMEDGSLLDGHGRYDYEVFGAMPGLAPGVEPAKDILIVAHGLNNTALKGINRFCLARESLQHCQYEGTVVGFSWDGSTNWDPWGATGYRESKHNAIANRGKLAQFVVDLRATNPEARIRLLGYSMGARLVAEAVRAMDEDKRFKGRSVFVDSVHLVGAAIDDEHLQTDNLYGKAIERHVGLFFNYYSPSDSKLGKYYPPKEADRAVGRHDLEDPEKAPFNYRSRNVYNELKPTIDKGGAIDTGGEIGRNHSSYLGIRDDSGKWLDDGAMNVVAQDIRIATLRAPQSPPRPKAPVR